MATPEVLCQSIREGLGKLQFLELGESARKVLTEIDRDLWDLVDDEMDEREKEEA